MHVDRSPGVQCKRNKITGIDLEKDREKWIRGVRGGNEPRINKPSVSREPNESSLTIEGDGEEKKRGFRKLRDVATRQSARRESNCCRKAALERLRHLVFVFSIDSLTVIRRSINERVAKRIDVRVQRCGETRPDKDPEFVGNRKRPRQDHWT